LPTTHGVTVTNELQSFANVIAGQSALEDAWTGKAKPTWVQKTCGLCSHEQAVRIPFVRHICQSCSSTWSPARCTTCSTTTIVFRRDPSALITARCFCAGELQLVAYLPRQRSTDPSKKPSVLASLTDMQVQRSSGRMRTIARAVGGVVALGSVVAGAWIITTVRSETPPPPAPVHQVVQVAPDGSPAAMGTAAGERLVARGRINNVFSCQAEYAADVQAPGSEWPGAEAPSPTNGTYLGACEAVDAAR